MSKLLTVTDESIFQENGTVHYKYRYRTEDGQEFIIGASIEEVPEALRGPLQWVSTRLKLRLQDLAIDIMRELER